MDTTSISVVDEGIDADICVTDASDYPSLVYQEILQLAQVVTNTIPGTHNTVDRPLVLYRPDDPSAIYAAFVGTVCIE